MKLRMFRRAAARGRNAALDDAAPQTPNFARRALLTGGAAMAGAVGASVAAAATAGPASAATGDDVVLGQTNDGTGAATVITAANNSVPTLIVGNTGSPGANQASPQLRLAPAANTGLYEPPTSSVGGDVVATGDGNLWFTHGTTDGAIPAAVHTDFTANSFAPLAVPYRVIDTRSSSGRSHVLDPSGKFDSTGRLLAGKTIHINLTSLVNYGDAMTANLTVINPGGNGWVLVWSGAGSRPVVSSIAFGKGQAIANLTVSSIAAYSSTVTDSIAITASATTHVLLDVAGFYVASLGQVNPTYSGLSAAGVSRASQARAAQAAAMRR